MVDIKQGLIKPKKPNHTKSSIKAQLHIQDEKLIKCRFHDLRHYHASQLYENNIMDQYAASRMGHDIETLKRIYQHILSSTRKEQDDKVINLFV